MAKRTIKHKAFRYFIEGPDPTNPDATTLHQRIAKRGETVELREADILAGEAGDAFEPLDGEEPEGEQEEVGIDIRDLEHDELVNWLEESRPSAPQTVAAAGGLEDEEERVAVAERLLEAERSVTGRDPRKTVEEGLERIINDAEEEE